MKTKPNTNFKNFTQLLIYNGRSLEKYSSSLKVAPSSLKHNKFSSLTGLNTTLQTTSHRLFISHPIKPPTQRNDLYPAHNFFNVFFLNTDMADILLTL